MKSPDEEEAKRVKVSEKMPSRERLDINQSSESIVDHKKLKIFEKVFSLLLIDQEQTYVPLIHPATINYWHLPF